MNDTNHQANSNGTPTPPPTRANPDEVLGGLKGKGPQEVLGAVSTSPLSWAMVQATLGSIFFLAVLTLVPYVLGKPVPDESKLAAAQKTDKPEEKPTPTTPTPEPKSTATTKTTGKPEKIEKKTTVVDTKKDQTQPPKDFVDRLKENEVKKDKPKDPLDILNEIDGKKDK